MVDMFMEVPFENAVVDSRAMEGRSGISRRQMAAFSVGVAWCSDRDRSHNDAILTNAGTKGKWRAALVFASPFTCEGE
jgi:hypothetical protein